MDVVCGVAAHLLRRILDEDGWTRDAEVGRAALGRRAKPGEVRLVGERVGGARLTGVPLVVEELLSQDVGVAAVLGQLAQHVQVHPTQREGAAPVAEKDVVQAQG